MKNRKIKLLESVFNSIKEAEVEKIPKNKWIKLSPIERKEYAKNLISIVQNAYKEIGGHFKVQSLSDVLNDGEYDVWMAIDNDQPDDIDAVSFGKRTKFGIKSGGMGQDGDSSAKKAVLDYKAKELKGNGYYSEMSGKMAEIMLNKFNCPFVDNEEDVEKVIGKKVEWFGEHPQGICKGKNGWYKRSVSGHTEIKILIGHPTGI